MMKSQEGKRKKKGVDFYEFRITEQRRKQKKKAGIHKEG